MVSDEADSLLGRGRLIRVFKRHVFGWVTQPVAFKHFYRGEESSVAELMRLFKRNLLNLMIFF